MEEWRAPEPARIPPGGPHVSLGAGEKTGTRRRAETGAPAACSVAGRNQ